MEKRDQLAIDRTILANQRTFLAFLRTGLMILVSGITFLKLFNTDPLLVITGYTLIPISIIIFAIGFILFFRMKRKINSAYSEADIDELEALK